MNHFKGIRRFVQNKNTKLTSMSMLVLFIHFEYSFKSSITIYYVSAQTDIVKFSIIKNSHIPKV